MPKRPCAQPGCPNTVRNGRCESCARRHGVTVREADTERRPWRKWYNSARWRKARLVYLQANPLAVDIFGESQGVIRPAQVIDHIVPHHGNPILFWDEANWQGLTKEDHDRKTALEDGGFGRRGR